MKLRLPQRLCLQWVILTSVAAIAAELVVGLPLYRYAVNQIYRHLQQSAARTSRSAITSLDVAALARRDGNYLKSYADQTAALFGCRVTIIDPLGAVLADSEIPAPVPPSVENHLKRPEIQQSLAEGTGFSLRRSATVGNELIYFSRRVPAGDSLAGFLRIAISTEAAVKWQAHLRNAFLLASLLIPALTAFLVFFLFAGIERRISALRQKAERISASLQLQNAAVTGNDLAAVELTLTAVTDAFGKSLETLRQDILRLQKVLSSVSDGIVALDGEQRVIFHNRAAAQFLQMPAEEAGNPLFYHVIQDRHLNALIQSFFEKPVMLHDEVTTSDHRHLAVVIAPLGTENRLHGGCVLTLSDISQSKQLEKIRRDFVANVSHEFKTPLAAIRGYAETLLDWGLEDSNKARGYLKKIVKQSRQLENLVTDLLQLARIERLENIELKNFNPLPILDDLAGEFSEAAARRQIEFSAQIGSSAVSILGDPEMFRSILVNLLDNAIKYTPEGGSVQLLLSTNEEQVLCSVKDTGVGIPPRYLDRIFERFYRVDKARSREIEGTGLGLSIVKHLAELQGAHIRVESEVGRGSCFSVEFRRAAPSPNVA